MSTFSGISTALSSLMAQRQALDVAGQNIANASTVGYTRQRADISSIAGLSTPSMYSSVPTSGNGATVTSISRLGDAFLDARLRTTTGTSAQLAVQATSYANLETTVGEPSTTGLSNQLSTMWSAWSDLANTPDSAATRSVVLQDSQAVVDRLKTLYRSASTEWSQSRSDLTSMVSDVNTTASSVADLNAKILSITNAGGSANELMDKRDQLITQLSSLTGATARVRDNGTVDVLVGGNALVDGARANAIAVTGAATFTNATASAPPANTVQIVWSANPAVQVPLSGGKLAGTLSVLAPPDASGTGGMLTEAAASYNAVATALATTVNAVHSTGQDQSGNPAGDFFALDPTQPAALGLSVAITDTTKIAAATTTGGLVDGSLADSISQLASASGSPDTTWSAFVVKLGVDAKSATSRATVAEAARSSAEGLQMAQTSVSTDEEATNMLTYQRAYEGSARVLTAIDQMLDTLINRTGMVGR